MDKQKKKRKETWKKERAVSCFNCEPRHLVGFVGECFWKFHVAGLIGKFGYGDSSFTGDF